MEKLEKDSGFSFFEKIDKPKSKNLCEVTGCKMISKEVMESIAFRRELLNARDTRQLDQIWDKIKNENRADSTLNVLYEKRLKELQGDK